ncbi:glycosyltransferase family 2 protein [Hyphococcus sp.]|uniref:glycosyltransferase family 2 protein n=1 Tax=Hyphococcus sp. TaxID=2038636 RepID=UPI002085BD40|nr:MAG: glycosyl transferase [Marinicaulis sp.]
MSASTPPAAQSVTLIIVNFNSGVRLGSCLDCLARQTVSGFEIIIIDNASGDDSLAQAEIDRRSVRLIEAGRNTGFAAANNMAAEAARGDWLAFLNPDAYPEPGWLEELLRATARHPKADAFGSRQLDAGDPSHLDGEGDVCTIFGVAYRGGFGHVAEPAGFDGECFSPCAAAALVKRSVFLDLGGFDERFFCYGEDVDFGFRLRNAGGRAVQVNSAVVLHEGSGVSGRHSAFTLYHGHRNRIWMFYKNMPTPLYWTTAPLRLVTDIALFVKAAAIGEAGAYIKAMRDGYGGLGAFRDDRRKISALRGRSGAAIAAALCWSPLKLLRRRADLRPLSDVNRPAANEQ